MALKFHVDKLSADGAHGWAWNENVPGNPVSVAALLNELVVAKGLADGFRPDLLAAKIGTGYHAFFLKFETRLRPEDLQNFCLIATDYDGSVKRMPLPNALTESPIDQFDTRDLTLGAQVRRLMKSGLSFSTTTNRVEKFGQTPAELALSTDMTSALGANEIKGYLVQADISAALVKAAIVNDTYPLPHGSNREGYAVGRDLVYWVHGYADFTIITKMVAELGLSGGRYYDFGGSTGRLFRHFAFQSKKWEVWSSDFNLSSVEFCLQAFPVGIRAFANTSQPSLPLPDGYFNLITACSVFTHINENETAWLLELRRILAVGGIACLSIHNEDSWTSDREAGKKAKGENRPDLADAKVLPPGKTVRTFRDDNPYYCTVYHSTDYIHRVWGRYLEIVRIVTLYLNRQAMVVVRRVD